MLEAQELRAPRYGLSRNLFLGVAEAETSLSPCFLRLTGSNQPLDFSLVWSSCMLVVFPSHLLLKLQKPVSVVLMGVLHTICRTKAGSAG